MERQNSDFVGDIKSFAFIKSSTKSEEKKEVKKEQAQVAPEISSKYDWYQNATHVFVTFKVSGDKELAKRTQVKFERDQVSLTFDGKSIIVPLGNPINTDQCQSTPTATKIELKLKKEVESVNWMGLEPGQGGLTASLQKPQP